METPKLKEVRKAKGMTAEEVAVKAMVAVSTIYNMERSGHDSNQSTVRRVAKALGVKLEELV